MKDSINKKECVTTSNIGYGLAGLVSALYLTLGFSADLKAEQNNEGKQANITEVIKTSDSTENSNVIDFDTAKRNFEKNFSKAEIDSLMAEYRNRYFQCFDNLSDDEKLDYIYEILKEDEKVKKYINTLLEDKEIIKAIRLGDKRTIEKKFVDLMGKKQDGYIFGIMLALCSLACQKLFD